MSTLKTLRMILILLMVLMSKNSHSFESHFGDLSSDSVETTDQTSEKDYEHRASLYNQGYEEGYRDGWRAAKNRSQTLEDLANLKSLSD